MARSLVIGGTRNLGPDLVTALVARGDEVTVVNRGVTIAAVGSGPSPVSRLVADRTDATALATALRGRSFDLVVDTTLYTGVDAKAAARILDGRCNRYVFWSTGQVYLVRLGLARPFGEEDYVGPVMPDPPGIDGARRELDHRNWVYGIDKRAAEDALMAAHAARGFPAVILRMPMINSERDHYGRIAGYVHRLLDGGPLLVPAEDGAPLRHVYGMDVVAATLLAGDRGMPAGSAGATGRANPVSTASVASTAATRPNDHTEGEEDPDGAAGAGAATGRAYNISQDETMTLGDMLARIATLVRRPAEVRTMPLATLLAAGLVPTCSPFSDPWMSSLDNTRSKHELGLAYTPVAEYLPRVIEAALALRPEAVASYATRRAELALIAGTS